MRCFGRARLTGAGVRPLLASFLRADGLAAAFLARDFRAGDFFRALLRLAARAGFFAGFFLAIDVLPIVMGAEIAQIAAGRWISRRRNPPRRRPRDRWVTAEGRLTHPTPRSMQPEHTVDGAQLRGFYQFRMRNRDREQRSFQLLLPE